MKISGGTAYYDFASIFYDGVVKSYSCRCDREPVNCEPEDFWRVELFGI